MTHLRLKQLRCRLFIGLTVNTPSFGVAVQYPPAIACCSALTKKRCSGLISEQYCHHNWQRRHSIETRTVSQNSSEEHACHTTAGTCKERRHRFYSASPKMYQGKLWELVGIFGDRFIVVPREMCQRFGSF